MRHVSPLPRRSSAFSLVELVIVIAIIGIISIFVIPAAVSIVAGTDINRASQLAAAQFSQARQVATTKNHQVEVRLLQFADTEGIGESFDQPATWKFRGIQMFEIFDNGNMALIGKTERLPGSIMMDEKRFSSMLDQTGNAEPNQKAMKLVDAQAAQRSDYPLLPRVPAGKGLYYKYVSFRYLPDGSTTLDPTGKWYLTMYSVADSTRLAKTGPPGVNYITLQIDAANGSVRTFRPSLAVAKK
jgi:uncharacterized protein (TIGR02596 family)